MLPQARKELSLLNFLFYLLMSICLCFLLLQGELFIGDQSGSIHIWDLKTDNNEQFVSLSM